MGLGLKIGMFAFVGIGVLAGIGGAKFAIHGDTRTPEQKLASAKSYFDSRCSGVTRNRYINGKLGRGHIYCKCIAKKLDPVIKNPDEYRYLAKLQSGVVKERWVFQKSRITAAVTSVRKEYMPILGPQRIRSANQTFFPSAKACTKSI
ncbi:MAG: hypothetical protein ACR2PF_11535 [Rhizobiaceae bacterium]